MGRRLGIFGVGAMVLFLAGPAWAADPPKPPPLAELVPKVRPSTRVFYGWQILASGGAGGVLTAASILLPDEPFGSAPSTAAFVFGAPLFALGGPTIHWSHGDFTKGLVSFGGNVTFSLAGGIIGRQIRCNETNASDDCAKRGFLTRLAVAALITPVIDALVLGWEDIPVDDARSPVVPRLAGRTRTYQLSIAPWSNIDPNGRLQLGLSGSF